MKSFRRIVVCLVALCASLGSVVRAAEGPPELLIIMPDQMRGDCLSILDHPAVKTPTLDRLAGEGTLFRRAYTTVPSCIPARYALLTGLYPQSSGVVGFRQKPIGSPTLPELLGRWRATLMDRLASRPEGFSDGKRLIPGRPYPPLNEGLRE